MYGSKIKRTSRLFDPENGVYSRKAATNAKKIKALFKMWLHLSLDRSDLFKSLFLTLCRCAVACNYFFKVDCSDLDAIGNHLELITLQDTKPCYVYGKVKGTEPEKYIVLDADRPDVIETDSFLNAVASVFNLVFFSPKRYSKMIKGINSESADKFKNGLKNAAWDLVYISHWGRNCKEANENTLWLLCSNDLALRGVACNIFEDPKMGENHLQHLLSYYWGAQKAATILDVYNKTFFSINSDPSLRDTVLKYRFSALDKSILSLERSVMTPIKTANYPAT